MPPHRLGRFDIDADLNVGTIHGDIAARLGCDSSELKQRGWEPYLLPDDMSVLVGMMGDLKSRQAGRYSICALPKDGGKLWLTLKTKVVLAAGQEPKLAGSIILDCWDTPRARAFLTGAQATVYVLAMLTA